MANTQKMIDRLNARLDRELEIVSELPDTITCGYYVRDGRACIYSDAQGGGIDFCKPAYSLLGSNKVQQTGLEVLEALEAAGWRFMPATKVKWDNYRPSVMLGYANDVPEKRNRYTVASAEAIGPLWITDKQGIELGGRPKAHAFYKTPNGLTVKVSVPAPQGYYVNGDIANRGPEGYEETYFQNPSMHVPHLGRAVYDGAECVGHIDIDGAWHDTDQSISGRVVFRCLIDQDEWPFTPAQMYAAASKQKGAE